MCWYSRVVSEDEVSVAVAVAVAGALFAAEINCRLCKSSLENDSSVKLDNHSSSAKSSYCIIQIQHMNSLEFVRVFIITRNRNRNGN